MNNKPLYATQHAWQAIQSFLPTEMHLDQSCLPSENWWAWQGHQVHLDRLDNPNAPARVILLHGVGTNGRQMSLIAGAPLFKQGFETIAIDLPSYGLTQVAANTTVVYDMWVQLVSDFINVERARDPRPIFLYGLSAGGMLAYHVAAHNGHVTGIIGMTFLDQRHQVVRDATSRNLLMSRVGVLSARIFANTPFGRLKMPMSWACKMYALVNHPAALQVFLQDKTSAGNWVSVRFLNSYMQYQPVTQPEDFKICPILLTQPAADTWTPLALSELFLQQLQHVSCQIVMLEHAGHYPLEESGLTQMRDAMIRFINKTISTQVI